MKRRSSTYYDRTARTFRERRYLFVKGILPRPLLDYLKTYYAVLLANEAFAQDEQCPSSLSLGADPGLDAVREGIRREGGRLVGLELAPIYSYPRRYANGEFLPRHVDGAACKI